MNDLKIKRSFTPIIPILLCAMAPPVFNFIMGWRTYHTCPAWVLYTNAFIFLGLTVMLITLRLRSKYVYEINDHEIIMNGFGRSIIPLSTFKLVKLQKVFIRRMLLIIVDNTTSHTLDLSMVSKADEERMYEYLHARQDSSDF